MTTIADLATWTGTVDGATWTNHGAMTVGVTGLYDATVAISVEVAFADNPLVFSPAWTDITTDVRSFAVTRGRGSELDDYKSGVLTLRIDGNQGDYDPADTAGANYPNVKPMKQVRVQGTYKTTTYDLFRGFVEAWPMSVKGHTDEIVTVKAVDGFKVLNLVKDATAQVEEASGVRVGNLLDEAGWPTDLRTIGTGVATIAAYTPVCSTALQLVRQVTDSEAGQFYMDGAGNAVYRNRTYRSGLTSQVTFTDKTGGIPYQGITTDYDDSQIWNRIQVLLGGFPSYSSSTASQDSYGIRQLTVNDILLPNTTDGDDLADVYLARYKDPLTRVESLTIRPEAQPSTMWDEALGRELSDKVTVVYTSNNGSTTTAVSYIESVSHRVSMSPRKWETKWKLSQIV